MLKDIVSLVGADLTVAQSEAPRAANILSTQLGSLEYAQDFGIDLRYFLESEFRIQNASFKAYLVQRLLEQHVNVVSVVDTVERLFISYTFDVGSSENNGSMVA